MSTTDTANGKPESEPRLCLGCGASLQGPFCSSCGRPVDALAAVSPGAAGDGEPPSNSGAIRVDEGMNPSELGKFALAMTGDSQTCTMPNLSAPSDPNRIIADPDRAKVLFNAIIEDTEVPKAACTPTGRARS